MSLFDTFKGKLATNSPKPAAKSDTTTDSKRYRGVKVVTNSDDCCQAASALKGQRFLMSQVPMLPLTDCDAAQCQCTYEHFDDRREDLRRASDVAFDVVGQFTEQDKRLRAKPDRRDTD